MIEVKQPAMRIVSLLPSATELVCCLGLQDQLVGITHECDFPERISHLPRVTRSIIPQAASSAAIDEQVRVSAQAKQPLFELDQTLLTSLAPDVIITQGLCDVCAVAESAVQAVNCRLPRQAQVINLEPENLSQVLECLLILGKALDCETLAQQRYDDLQFRLNQLRVRVAAVPSKSVVLLEWLDPLFSAGHWSPELVSLAGGQELIGSPAKRSSRITWDTLLAADPQIIIVACCGWSVARTVSEHATFWQSPSARKLRAVQQQQVWVVDGNAYFNRPGPRLVDSAELLATLFHPELKVPERIYLPAKRLQNEELAF